MTEPAAPITIKSFPIASREKMKAAAARRDQTQGEWLARAIETQANIEARDLVEPGLFEPPAPTPAPPGMPFGLTELRLTMEAAAATAAATGVPVPKAIARHVYALLGQELRAARGIPPRAPRGKPEPKSVIPLTAADDVGIRAQRQTTARIGHTVTPRQHG
jgi:hypothetical protein